jgi:magnesium chelatase family protein
VLFLDEICEFNKDVIESLRTPIEEKKITHFRKGEAYTFPCNFQVVMAANPCPCGFFGDPDRECTCSQADLERYKKKLSGPIIDRIDMRITMERVKYDELTGTEKGLTSEQMRNMVETALSFSEKRGQLCFNSEIPDHDLERYCRLGTDESKFMNRAYDTFSMSPRAYNRTIKVARTIADLDESPDIKTSHIAEALSYRIQE